MSLHCQHSQVVAPTGMFWSALQRGQRIALIPQGAGGAFLGRKMAMITPIIPKISPRKKPTTAPRFLEFVIAAPMAAHTSQITIISM